MGLLLSFSEVESFWSHHRRLTKADKIASQLGAEMVGWPPLLLVLNL